MNLIRHRDQWLHELIQKEVASYLGLRKKKEKKKRSCATCGRKFFPKNPWHFFCQGDCRRWWYRGQFRPRGD